MLTVKQLHNGVWLSLVERYVRDVEAAGSNPVTPILGRGAGNLEVGGFPVFYIHRPIRKHLTAFVLKYIWQRN